MSIDPKTVGKVVLNAVYILTMWCAGVYMVYWTKVVL